MCNGVIRDSQLPKDRKAAGTVGIGNFVNGKQAQRPQTGVGNFFNAGIMPKPTPGPVVPPGKAPIEGKEADFKRRGGRSLLSSFSNLVQAKASFGE